MAESTTKQFNRYVYPRDVDRFEAERAILGLRSREAAAVLFRRMLAAYLHVGSELARELADRANGQAESAAESGKQLGGVAASET